MQPPNKGRYYQAPMFNHRAGYLTTMYDRDFIEAAQTTGSSEEAS